MAEIQKPFFVVPIDLGTVASSAAYAGYPVTNINRLKSIGLTWKASASGGLWARGQFASAQIVDFCAIVAANAQLGTLYRLRLGYSSAEVGGTGAAYDSGWQPFIPSFDSDAEVSALSLDFLDRIYLIETAPSTFHSHLEMDAPQAATWWRIDISNHSGDFQCAALVLGKKVQPTHFYNLDFEFGAKDLGTLDITRMGVWDEEYGKVLRTVAFTLGWTSEAEYEASFRPMIEKLGKRGIVYVVFDPSPTAYRVKRTYMGVFDKPPGTKGIRKPRTYTQDFEITSMI